MALRKGGAAAKAADKANRPSFDKVEFFKIEDDEDFLTLRFFDDGEDWAFTDMHSYVPTRGPAPDWDDEKKAKYPTRNGAVCRKDENFDILDDDGHKVGARYDDCFICDHMTKENGKAYRPTIRVWARAIVRKPVIGTQKMADAGKIPERRVGKPVGYAVEMIDVEENGKDGKPNGNKVRKPRVVVVNMGMKNFFNAMQGYYQALEGSVLAHDFKVTRDGTGTDTNYIITALDKTPDWDLAEEEHRKPLEQYMPDIEKLVEDRASDDYYAYFFDKRVPHPERKKDAADESDNDGSDKPAAKKGKAPAPAETAKAENGVDAERLKQMSQGVRSRYGKKAPKGEDTAAVEADDEESTETAAVDTEDDDSELVGVGAVTFSGNDED